MNWQKGLATLFLMAGPAGTAADIETGRARYAHHCAACHGAAVDGAPDWQRPGPDRRLPAPPHDETGHSWHHGVLLDDANGPGV